MSSPKTHSPDWSKVETLEALKQAKHVFFEEHVKAVQAAIKVAAEPGEKARLGKQMTALKAEAEAAYEAALARITKAELAKQIASEYVDVTAPLGHSANLHPISIIGRRFREWFLSHGYVELSGGEVESPEYNFTRLNVPEDHPARDVHDTLYLENGQLMRTHNTGFTARALEANANLPFAAFSIGRVYRNDEDDATHSHQFTQVDIVAIGADLSIRNLIWTLKDLLSYVLEIEAKVRLRPSYFPFTEPSVEVDVFYNNKWIEVLGAGILEAKVLKMAGYTNEMTAFAAGIGVERLAMIKFNVQDIRELYLNDARFLKQFLGAK